MDFATELVSSGGSTTPGTGNPPGLSTDRTAVKTGDDTEIMRYVIMMFCSGLILLIGGILILRRQQEEEKRGERAV